MSSYSYVFFHVFEGIASCMGLGRRSTKNGSDVARNVFANDVFLVQVTGTTDLNVNTYRLEILNHDVFELAISNPNFQVGGQFPDDPDGRKPGSYRTWP